MLTLASEGSSVDVVQHLALLPLVGKGLAPAEEHLLHHLLGVELPAVSWQSIDGGVRVSLE
jgi:hypothetical protein